MTIYRSRQVKKRFDFFPAPDGLSGRVVFYFDKKDDGRRIDTGWLKSGLKEKKPATFGAAVQPTNATMLVTALKLADDKLYFGAAGLFDEVPASLDKAKIAAAVDEKSGKIRFAVKLKSAETEKVTLVYRIVGPASAVAEEQEKPAVKAAPAVPAAPGQPLATPAAKEAPAGQAASSDVPVGGAEEEDDSFYIENPPAAIHCGWKYTLRAHVPAGMKGTVHWEIGEEGAGMIDQNGQYTAPSRPGAYEVIARFVPEKQEEAETAATPGAEDPTVAAPGEEDAAEASVYLIVL